MDALDALGILDEVLNIMAIDPFRRDLKANADLNSSISEVEIPESFPLTSSNVFDIINIVENELQDQGYGVSIKQVSRPNANTVQFSFESENGNDIEIDKAIESIVSNLTSDALISQNSSLEDTNGKTYEVYYTDENGNEMKDPALIRVPENLDGMELYEFIQEAFYEQYPDCMWDTIADADGDIKVDASSALNCSVHDNPALKMFVDKVKQTAKQVSAVPTTEDGMSGYKIIVRGMDSSEIEPIAAEFGLQLSGIKPLEGGFSILVAEDSLNSSNIDPETSELTDEGLRYRGYFITGSDQSGYVCVSDYGKFSPAVYKTIDEAKEAIDKDMKIRFPEGDCLDSSVDTDKLYEIANRYCTSSPVSGDWDTETEHELKAIMEELGVNESEAKRLMIDVLGFDEAMLN